ncbi:hypothetical protein FRC00_005436 [Tulasnella sp. 408]|nr:hypothetical protein FRC00_005436 [Tulasnella sp. 408]
MSTFARSPPAKDEVLDQCLSDVSMEDGNDGGPRPTSPTTQPDGGSKSGRSFTGKLDRMLKERAQYIKWVNENTISIPNTANFVTHVLKPYCGEIQGDHTEGSVWVRKKATQINNPATKDTAQAKPPTASDPSLDAMMDELRKKLRAATSELDATRSERDATRSELSATRSELSATRSELSATRSELSATRSELSATRSELSATRSELSATRSELNTTRPELKETRDLLSENQSEVKRLTTLLLQLFSSGTAEPVPSGRDSSHSVPRPGLDSVVAHGPSLMNPPDGYGGIFDESRRVPRAGAYSTGAPQVVSFDPEITPSYNPVGPAFPAGQPGLPQSPDYDFVANSGVPQTYPGGYTTLGGPIQQAFMLQGDPVTMPQVATTGYVYQQGSASATGSTDLFQDNLVFNHSPVVLPPQALGSTQPSNPVGAFGRSRRPCAPAPGLDQVPPPPF